MMNSSHSDNAFGKTLRASAFALVASVLMACQGETVAQTVDESKYKPVNQEFPVTSGDKVEVVELFWFGCGHCFALEPSLKSWNKAGIPDNASFKKVPALFSSRWEFHGQAFYTMKALDMPEEAYDKFFSTIHIERKQLNNMNQLVSLLEKYGKTEAEVEAAFNSFAVDTNMRAAKRITRASGARGVPAIVVDGKYLTNQQLSGGTQQMFDVVNQLVDKAATER